MSLRAAHSSFPTTTQPEARGVAIALYLFIGQMVGNIAPVVLGKIDDETIETVQTALLVAVGISYIGCAAVFLLVGNALGSSTSPICRGGGKGDSDPLLDEQGAPQDAELPI